MKKRLILLLSVIALIIVTSAGIFLVLRYYTPLRKNIVFSQNLNRKDLDLVISDYIKNNYMYPSRKAATEKYEAHKIYGIDEKFGLKYVYLYTLFQEGASSGANPLVIIVKEDSKGMYSVVNHKEPKDGDDNRMSLRIIFPHKYLKEIDGTKDSKELQKKIELQN